ncbi:hypothetical protein Q4512_05520 [Oceanihabitans sp. 2_MG-2023]|uniref:hypothetical protein n=1 Tax=Oceanihabitans sp. 2_MG-2023 TaxID=3062661 RepID=UPI0026E16F1A|nr:hypothetical protein [Oceanihabitans sp. 2_MG-2023]MDO6596364.1 hypothetical protein [Oceanihabitans sp. 2_MG-2023]
MRNLYIIGIICLFCSCSFIKLNKLVNNQDIKFSNQLIPFEISNNRISLKDSVNFFLDIGAPNIIYSEKLKSLNIKDSIKIGELVNSNGKRIENKSIVIELIKNNFFEVNNAVFRVLPNNTICNDNLGLIGCELFYNEVIGLDFKNNIIQKLPVSFIKNNKDYKELKVLDFDGYYFIISLSVNGQYLNVKLDTGNPYSLLLTKEDFNKIKTETYSSYFMNRGKLDTVFNSRFKSMENDFIVKSNNYIKRNLMGVQFLKNYNWVLDYTEGKVYYKKNKNNKITENTNRSIIQDDKLIFYQSNNQSEIYKLGNVINSVDNIIVTEKNICYLNDLLNNKINWSTLNIEFLK